MIRDAQTAKRALELISESHKLLMDSLALVEANCSQEEYKEYQSGMAHVLGRLFFLVMEPIYCHHPALAPPETPREFVDTWVKGKASAKPKPGTNNA